jgi:ATP-dependent RNA helicase DeaD
MVTYRLEVGNNDGISPSNIVGAIANEADIESRFIGEIKLHDDYSTVDLPEGMPADLLNHLKKVRVCAKPMRISVLGGSTSDSAQPYAEKVATPRKRKIADSDDKRTISRNVENKRTAEPRKPAKKVFTGNKKTFAKDSKSTRRDRTDRSDRRPPSNDGSAPLKKKKTYTKKPKRSK